MKAQDNQRGADLGFQIAPMIDVVFVIMLFFMVMAGAVKVEYELKIKLPGEDPPPEVVMETPDELTISINELGQVAINDSNVDGPTSKELPELLLQVGQLKQNASIAGTKLLVTVEADELATYDRIALVLDTLAKAKAIDYVTFAVGGGEGEG
ncbi:MAG: biopolymer transporter ExbD [Puniceicoccales bacterium]|jgi:biopolymer transport protein ExbD|nr:biopolymer transporter ExbD [Puniceicoccales bacterium]